MLVMRIKDEALTISNPRLLSAAYFALLAVIATIIIDTLLFAFGVEQILPTFQLVSLSAILAGCFGAIFGEKIVHCQKPYRYKTFSWGFIMVLAALPFYSLFFLYLFSRHHQQILSGLSFGSLLELYLFVVLYSFLLFGLWLAIAAGLAAIFLRGHLVYDILDSKNERRKSSPQKKTLGSKEKNKSVKLSGQDKRILH
jgi:hypothetical protein